MKLRTLIYATIIAVLPVQAMMCSTHEAMTGALAKKYKESRVSMGVIAETSILEIYASANGETWTILVTTPEGRSCIIGAGKGWQEIKPQPSGMKA